MRVPIVSPANDEYSCRELSLFEWREKYRRVRKEGAHLIKSTRRNTLVEEESSLIVCINKWLGLKNALYVVKYGGGRR